MTHQTPDTLRELHQIRERLAQEHARLSARDRVTRTRQDAEALLAQWGLSLRHVPPLSATTAR